MKKKQWIKMTEKEKVDYAFRIGVESCRSLRLGLAKDRELEKLIEWSK